MKKKIDVFFSFYFAARIIGDGMHLRVYRIFFLQSLIQAQIIRKAHLTKFGGSVKAMAWVCKDYGLGL